MSYPNLPAEVALSRYMRDQDRAEDEYEASLPARRMQAQEALTEPDELRKVLNDEPFAYPLARLFSNFEQAGKEVRQLDPLLTKCPHVEGLLQAVAQLERQAFQMLMGEE